MRLMTANIDTYITHNREQQMRMSKEEFKKLYYSKTDPEIAKILGVKTVVTVRRYAKSLGLKKGIGFVYPNDKRKKKKVEFV